MNTDSDLRADRRIARALGRAWDPFFARFGRLTSIQREAIPPILEGANVLVAGPTASGKTEAVCAPLVRCFGDQTDPWTVLFIVPTRALVNDLYERLYGPLAECGLRLARRTGDHRDMTRGTPHFLLTTPESFDSLLCRGRMQDGTHILSHVQAVVLDELHLYTANPRGEHIRWLLARLARLRDFALTKGWVKNAGFQRVGLSATLPDIDAVIGQFFDGDAICVQSNNPREIETVGVEVGAPDVENCLPEYLQSIETHEKILVFCNARRRVDQLTHRMRPILNDLGYEAVAHHGSLSKRIRESAEDAIKTNKRIVAFATSTLELGVDIGDIDLVILDGPAPDISSLLQRLGRGNRRTDKTRVMMCSGNLSEVIVHSAMIQAARNGDLGQVETGPCYAVARQQIASFIFQSSKRARTRRTIRELVSSRAPDLDSDRLVDHLVQIGDFQEDRSGVRLGDGWMEMTTMGAIHSNIESAAGSRVVDDETGQEIARGVDYRGSPGLKVGGQLLQVVDWSDWRVDVQRTANALPEGDWGYHSSNWMKGAGQPQAVRKYLGLPADVWPVVSWDGIDYVFHFGGDRRKAVLKLIGDLVGGAMSSAKINAWYMTLPASAELTEEALGSVDASMVSLRIADSFERLERALARPYANASLPHEARLDEVRRWLDVDNEVSCIVGATWERGLDAETREVLERLQHDLIRRGRSI